jgi:hypothetical protein
MSGSGRPLRGRPTTRRRATRRFMHAVRLAQKTSANRTGELSRAVPTCAHLRTAIATDPRLDKVMAYAAQPVISDFAACSLPSLRGSQRPQGPALDIRSVIHRPTRRSVGAWTPSADGEFHTYVKNAAGSSGHEVRIINSWLTNTASCESLRLDLVELGLGDRSRVEELFGRRDLIGARAATARGDH